MEPNYKIQFIGKDGAIQRESERSAAGLAHFLAAVVTALEHSDVPTRIELHDANGECVIITRDN